VPTGKTWRIFFAGYIAREMGLPMPIWSFTTNQNDILHAADHGDTTRRRVQPRSASNDIQGVSNFERALLFCLWQEQVTRFKHPDDDLAKGGFDVGDNCPARSTEHL